MTEQDAAASWRTLDITEFAKAGYLEPGQYGTARWPRGDAMDSIDWRVGKHALHVSYAATLSPDGQTSQYAYDIPLKRTRSRHVKGGTLFLCPQCKAGVERLYYVPPGGGFFLCDECHGLDEEEPRPGRPRRKRAYLRKKPLVLTERSSDTEAFCCRCRDRRELMDIRTLVMSNGRTAIQGTCAVCGTTAARIVKGE